MKQKINIVLVHGAWGDGSHWRKVIPILTAAGYKVAAVQNPLTSLADNSERAWRLVDSLHQAMPPWHPTLKKLQHSLFKAAKNWKDSFGFYLHLKPTKYRNYV